MTIVGIDEGIDIAPRSVTDHVPLQDIIVPDVPIQTLLGTAAVIEVVGIVIVVAAEVLTIAIIVIRITMMTTGAITMKKKIKGTDALNGDQAEGIPPPLLTRARKRIINDVTKVQEKRAVGTVDAEEDEATIDDQSAVIRVHDPSETTNSRMSHQWRLHHPEREWSARRKNHRLLQWWTR